MTRKSILKASAVALGLSAAVVAGPVWAESGFKALEGVEARALSAEEMEAVQGRFFYDMLGVFGYMARGGPVPLSQYYNTNYYYVSFTDGTIAWFYRNGNRVAAYKAGGWEWDQTPIYYYY